MVSIKRLLFAIMLMFTGLYGLAQENILQAYIPADAKTVIHLNLQSLATKLSWRELTETALMKQALDDAPASARGLLSDPSASGINFGRGLMIVMLTDPKDKTKTYPVIYGQLGNAAKFTSAVKQLAPKEKITAAGKVQVLVHNKQSLAWTSQVFVMALPKGKKDKTKTPGPSSKGNPAPSTTMIKQIQQLLTPVSKSINTQAHFSELLHEPGDIHVWINRNVEKPKTKGGKKDEVLKMMNWGLLQQGNYMAGTLNFESGKAVMQMKSYMSQTMDSLYRLYPSQPLNQTIFKKLPPGQPIALISFSMSPELLMAMMKAAATDKLLDSLTRTSTIKPADIAAGLNGDFTLAVIKANEVDDRDSLTAALQGLQVFATASIKNKEKWQPLVDLLNKPKALKTDEEGNEIKPAGPLGGMKPKVLLNDSFVVVSLSPFAAEKFMSSSAETNISAIASSYANYPTFFSLDLKALFNFAMQAGKNKNKSNDQMAKVSEALDRFVIYGGNYEKGAAHSTMELQFADKQENSLKYLVTFLGDMMEMGKKKERPSKPEEESGQ